MDHARNFLYISNMAGARDSIRNYNLFGETGEMPDVVHCETIQTRSRMHNWELRPHRHARLHQFLLIESGGGMADLDGRAMALDAGDAVNIPRGHVHGFAFRADTEGWVVTLTSDLLDQALHPGAGLRPLLGAARIVPSDRDLRRLFQRIFAEYAGHGFARAQVLRSQAGSLIGLMARAIAADSGGGETGREALFGVVEDVADAFEARAKVVLNRRETSGADAHETFAFAHRGEQRRERHGLAFDVDLAFDAEPRARAANANPRVRQRSSSISGRW